MRLSFCILITLLLLVENVIGQAIFKSYDFNKGGYSICLLEGPMGKDRGMPVCPVRDEYAMDTTSFYYTSDTNVLNRLKKEVVLYPRPSKNGMVDVLQCGYPYWLCVFKGGTLLLKLPANIECGYIQTSRGQLLFHSKALTQYRKSFKPLILKYTCFSSAEESSQFIENIEKDFSYVSCKVVSKQAAPKFLLVETVQQR